MNVIDCSAWPVDMSTGPVCFIYGDYFCYNQNGNNQFSFWKTAMICINSSWVDEDQNESYDID